MSIVPWKRNPPLTTSPLFDLHRELSDFFDVPDFFERTPQRSDLQKSLQLVPSVNIVEDTETFKVEFELAGVDEKDISVSLADGYLRIKAEKEVSSKNKDKDVHLSEIQYGSYARAIKLPNYVDPEKAEASFKKGMLWVTLPKKSESIQQSRELPIRNADK